MSKLYKGGRPPKRKTERMNIVMSDTEYLNIQKGAAIMGVSMSEFLRDGATRTIRHLKSKGLWDTVPSALEEREGRGQGFVDEGAII